MISAHRAPGIPSQARRPGVRDRPGDSRRGSRDPADTGAARDRQARSVTNITDIMAALIGLGTILTALTLVWMISVRLRDASIADICWGFGFVLLVWLYGFLSPALTPRVGTGRGADDAVRDAAGPAHLPS